MMTWQRWPSDEDVLRALPAAMEAAVRLGAPLHLRAVLPVVGKGLVAEVAQLFAFVPGLPVADITKGLVGVTASELGEVVADHDPWRLNEDEVAEVNGRIDVLRPGEELFPYR